MMTGISVNGFDRETRCIVRWLKVPPTTRLKASLATAGLGEWEEF
ncbi:MAG: hypothetical protein ACXW03_06185 [Methylobacter sp.]